MKGFLKPAIKPCTKETHSPGQSNTNQVWSEDKTQRESDGWWRKPLPQFYMVMTFSSHLTKVPAVDEGTVAPHGQCVTTNQDWPWEHSERC